MNYELISFQKADSHSSEALAHQFEKELFDIAY